MKNAHGHVQDTNLLIRLRAKPHHVKQIVSLVITVVIFSAILFVWWSSRDASFRQEEIHSKTVSPLDGVTSMFDGFVSGFKKSVSDSEKEDGAVATTTNNFDISEVVVIDPSATTTASTSTQAR